MHTDFWLTLVRRTPEINQITFDAIDSGVSVPYYIDPDDPLVGYFQDYPETVETEILSLNSPLLDQVKKFEVKRIVPLFSRGELLGFLSLDEQTAEGIKPDGRSILDDLASRARTLLRIAELVRRREMEISESEWLDYEQHLAHIIQESLVPDEIPRIPGWKIKAYFKPARDVSGDFYDFFDLPNGRTGLFIGDVTDKGLPSTLVMAATRSILRAAMAKIVSPGQALSQVNNILCADIPHNMFITCLCIVLDFNTGNISYANAGHNLPICQRMQGIEELQATGMPLGLFPEMDYEEGGTKLEPGDKLLLFSDGLVEAHNQDREMFGFGRLRELVEECIGRTELEDILLSKLDEFTGKSSEQEDDVAFVSLQREQQGGVGDSTGNISSSQEGSWNVLGEFTLPSVAGVEREASERVIGLLGSIALSKTQRDRLTTAVAEATMNAIEHGNQFDPEKPVLIKVNASDNAVSISITDQGGSPVVPESKDPDLEAKLAGLESPRGWGLFIIRKMVDHFEIISSEYHHTVILTMFLGGEADAG